MPSGGQRIGAGRPHGSGKYGEDTVTVRVPRSLVPTVQEWLATYREGLQAIVERDRKARHAEARTRAKLPKTARKAPTPCRTRPELREP